MRDFDVLSCGGDAGDPEQFEKNVIAAKRQGYRTISIGAIVGITPEQRFVEGDTWEYFSFLGASLYKVFETDLIAGYFKPETYRRNQEALRWKSAILRKHRMRAALAPVREPMWMPTPWYDDKPELKGCACEHPSVALAPHYALNIDHPRVLAHYYQIARQLAELAPAIETVTFCSNDSGGGINWSQGLYPGPNGPADTQHRDMGERMMAWVQAVLDGSRAGGNELRIVWELGCFSPEQLASTARAFGSRVSVLTGSKYKANAPFTGYWLEQHLHATQPTGTPVVVDCPHDGSYNYAPIIGLPLLQQSGEMLMALKARGVRTLIGAYTQPGPLPGSKAPMQRLIESCLKSCPADARQLEARIVSVARKLVGARHAPALYSAWKDLDHAHRSWRGEYEDFLNFFYSVVGRRWLTRPFVPNPATLTDEERGYWSQFVMKDRDLELGFRTLFAAENRVLFHLPEYHWYYDALESMDYYLTRGVQTLDASLAAETGAGDVRIWLQDQRDRLDMLLCLVRCNLHATGMQWIIDRFAGKPDADKYAQAREKKRMFDMMDGEIENCRHIIHLMQNAVAPLITVGEEATYTLPAHLPALLEKKMAVMQRHRAEVEELFPRIQASGYVALSYSVNGGHVTAEEAAAERGNG
ncbi:MAG: hypothetical protein K8T26_08170 [Lentisphaerae bacterium]|nr:hypothetical protein [Lentisphaerota bacterium]